MTCDDWDDDPAGYEDDDWGEEDEPHDEDCYDEETGELRCDPCWKCGGHRCPGYCDDYHTYNLRPAETGGTPWDEET